MKRLLRPRSIETPTRTSPGHDKAAAVPIGLTQVVCYNRRMVGLLQLQVEPYKNLGAGFCLGIWQRSGDHVGYVEFVMIRHVRTPAPTRVSWNIRRPISLVPLPSWLVTPLYSVKVPWWIPSSIGLVVSWFYSWSVWVPEQGGCRRKIDSPVRNAAQNNTLTYYYTYWNPRHCEPGYPYQD